MSIRKMRRSKYKMLNMILAAALILGLCSAGLAPSPAEASSLTPIVDVDTTIMDGTSNLSLGVTHTHKFWEAGEAEAVQRAKDLLKPVINFQNVHIMGWGAENPWKSKDEDIDYSSLDKRINMMRELGGELVITFCTAPGWMKTSGNDWNMDDRVKDEHVDDFAYLAAEIAKNYPDVKHFQIWNEFKGYWNGNIVNSDGTKGNYDYIKYTEMYNKVYTAVKEVRPDAVVGGFYLSLTGDGSETLRYQGNNTHVPFNAKDMDAMEYWLTHKVGADFIALDRWFKDWNNPNKITLEDGLELAWVYGKAIEDIKAKTDLPIWFSEYYSHQNAEDSSPYVGAAMASIYYHMIKAAGGREINALLWNPTEGEDFVKHNLFTSTDNAGGGQPTPHYYVYKGMHDYFSAGKRLVKATSSDPNIEVLATVEKTMLINKYKFPRDVRVNGRIITLDAYEVRFMDPPLVTVNVDDTHPNLIYTGHWNTDRTNTGFFGQTQTFIDADPGIESSVELTFTGNEISWYYAKGLNRGVTDVYIDGVKEATVDLYTPVWEGPSSLFYKQWDQVGTHTIKLVPKAEKHPDSTSYYSGIDRFEFIGYNLAVEEQVEEPDSGKAEQIHFTLTGPHSVTFDWKAGPDEIHYWETSSDVKAVQAGEPDIVPMSSEGPWREARITGLKPDTTYHYYINEDEEYTFRTAPIPGNMPEKKLPNGNSGFKFVTTGDVGSTLNHGRSVGPINELIASLNADVYFGLGDYTYANTQSDMTFGMRVVERHFNDVMLWSTHVPFMPLWGNHEWDRPGDNLTNYKGRFDLPNSRTEASSPKISYGKGDWNWFDYGNTRFIIQPEPYNTETWSNWVEQVDPIYEQAQLDPNITFIVTLTHRQVWATSSRTSDSTLQSMFRNFAKKYPKYVLHLNGHNHNYERTNPEVTDGVVFITVGTGGVDLNGPPIVDGCIWSECPAPDWSAERFYQWGALQLTFEEDKIAGEFYCGPSGGFMNAEQRLKQEEELLAKKGKGTCDSGVVLDTFTIQSADTSEVPSPASADISVLKVNGQPLSGFDHGQLDYEVNVSNDIEFAVVTTTLTGSDAKVVVTGGNNLVIGENLVYVTINQNDTEVKKYTIKVNREGSSGEGMTGTGKESDPFIIKTAAHLDSIRDKLGQTSQPGDYAWHYKLGADIDLDRFDAGDGKGWMPIGTMANPFYGSLDGNGYVISNLFINRPDISKDVGLFGYSKGKVIFKNIRLENVHVTGQTEVGALIGLMSDQQPSVIENTYATGVVKGTGSVGGLIGDLQHTTILNSYAIVDVTGNNSNVGGLAGKTSSSAAKERIINSYSAGKVSIGGGILGGGSATSPQVVSSYWDLVTSARPTSFSGGVGKSTADMKKQSTFVGWDFDNLWTISEGVSYPTHRSLRPDAMENVNLSGLSINGIPLAGFSADKLTGYTMNVLKDVNSVTVSATFVADSNTKLEVTGGSALVFGPNLVKVTVTAQDSTIQAYEITVSREADVKSSKKNLADLKVNGKTFEGFDPSVHYYMMDVSHGTTELTVEAAVEEGSNAMLDIGVVGKLALSGNTVSNLQVADNTVKFTVTAEDGTKQIYLLVITRGPYIPTPEETMSGSGSITDPYIVTSAIHLNLIRDNLSAHFKQGANIDLSGYSAADGLGWLPIGDSVAQFRGSYDGNGYKITGLTINRPTMDYVGLFSYSTGIHYKNVRLEDVNVTGKNRVGGLVAYMGGSGSIANSSVTGSVTGNQYVGGLVGGGQRSPISNSYTDVKVTGVQYVGGLTGYLDNQNDVFGKVTNSYSVGEVSGQTDVGGLIGGVKDGPSPKYSITSSYWDTQSSNQLTSVYGTGKTTAEMKMKSTFVGWDFVKVWEINEGNDYPRHRTNPVSSNAELTDLKVDGTTVSGFNSNKLDYIVNVPNTTSSTVVTYTKADENATVVISGGSNLVVGNNTVKVTVTAQDLSTKKVFVITIKRAPSSNANLSDLKIDGTTVSGFSANKLIYIMNVPNSTTSLAVSYTKSDVKAKVEVSNTNNLVVGANTVTVKVVAEDNTEKEYVIIVNRAVANNSSSSNSKLSDLKVNGTTVSEFRSDKLIYVMNVPNSTDSVTVSYTKQDENATVEVSGANGLVVGANTVTVKVVAEDNTEKEYVIIVNRAVANNSGGSIPVIIVPPKENQVKLPAGKGGTTSFEESMIITIPEGATQQELNLSVEKVKETSQLITDKDVLLSPIFEILKNFTKNFSIPVTLTFVIDPHKLGEGQTASVFFYDEDKKVWVEIGGIASGYHVTVEVNHFTKFAVFAVDKKSMNPDTVFSDIASHWAMDSIKLAASKGIVSGYADGTFKPDGTVTRAEFSVMLANALNLQGDGAVLNFTDEATIGSWARKAISQAVQAGIVKGYGDGSFRPNAKVSRAEMVMMLANALGIVQDSRASTSFADDADIPVWAKAAVEAAVESGIVKGRSNNRFAPKDTATRAEAVTVLLKALEFKHN
ncbi:hypothetical protein FHS15_003205 [Paenibacillus castaneae]|uniref:cadherin-like beta sandwich domain-containing protein n=1 Tax=Paenibacillus castaneae TaxID=474957 RepID=UPI000C99C77C|nr:cadherin-like beta sandwich domain-containing protein [Paenibacillus castaneae]NIK78067.1 hypothetical protein [Paenibacillus castaneae]